MNAKQYKYVLTLAREGSFSKAADTLNISQPSLSQYIKKIETEIGLELFDRSGGDVKITDAGRIYVEAGQRILDIEHQMENAFTDLTESKTGSLVIGAAPYRAASMLPLIAKRFRSLHPGMHLIVREGTTAELAEGMEHGEYDLALTLLPIDRRLSAMKRSWRRNSSWRFRLPFLPFPPCRSLPADFPLWMPRFWTVSPW